MTDETQEEEEEFELSNTAKAIAGLVAVGTITGIATWLALAKGKDTPLDRYMAQQAGGGDGDGQSDEAVRQFQQDARGPEQEAHAEKTLWDSIVEAFGPDVYIASGGGGYGDADDV